MYRVLVLMAAGCGPVTKPQPPTSPSLFEQAQAAAAANPKNATVQFQFGEVALAERKNDVAEKAFTACLEVEPDHPLARDRRGDARLKLGKFKEAVEDFDAYLKERPMDAPRHWRRGIALYYAGKYAEGAKQFETHKLVNPEDVENAAWHFLCTARDKGVTEARKGLITVTDDPRVPMAQVQRMFAGKGTPEEVLATAAKLKEETGAGKEARFYGHLYVGLYYEATGEPKKAKEHVKTAAEKYPIGHYMWDVAAAHVKTFQK